MVDQKNNPVLADSISRLSDLLRYVVDEVSSEAVPIQKEITFIRNYAALQLLRFEKEEVKFNMQTLGSYTNQPVEPGIFIPFVENAFKYGTEPEKKAAIEIIFDLTQADRIVFSIVNPVFESMRKSKGKGTGIDSVKQRLQLMYPQRHDLKIEETDHFFVELKIFRDASDYSG
jgi:LytS/YehU family sensor histidine kinase